MERTYITEGPGERRRSVDMLPLPPHTPPPFFFFLFSLPPQVNKQLADKERVAAALENGSLIDVVHKCLIDGNRIGGDAPPPIRA